MIVEYLRDDVLEHIESGRRVKITKVGVDFLTTENLDSNDKRRIGRATLRRDYANLTAQQEGRYTRVLTAH